MLHCHVRQDHSRSLDASRSHLSSFQATHGKERDESVEREETLFAFVEARRVDDDATRRDEATRREWREDDDTLNDHG